MAKNQEVAKDAGNLFSRINDITFKIMQLGSGKSEERKTLDSQLANYLGKVAQYAQQNKIPVPEFPIKEIKQSNYSLPEVLAQINTAESELDKYLALLK